MNKPGWTAERELSLTTLPLLEKWSAVVVLGNAGSCIERPQSLVKLTEGQNHDGDRGLSAHTFSQRQITYHLLDDLLAVLSPFYMESLHLHLWGGVFMYHPEFPAGCETCSGAVCLG